MIMIWLLEILSIQVCRVLMWKRIEISVMIFNKYLISIIGLYRSVFFHCLNIWHKRTWEYHVYFCEYIYRIPIAMRYERLNKNTLLLHKRQIWCFLRENNIFSYPCTFQEVTISWQNCWLDSWGKWKQA